MAALWNANVPQALLGAARPAAEIALVVALAKVAAGFVWLGWPPADQAIAPAPSAATQAAARSAAIDHSVLTAYDPFAAEAAEEPTFEDAPETTLNLTITGIRRAGREGQEESVAYVMLPDGDVKLVQAGDPLSPGVEVRRVLEDRVILVREGRDEVLRFGSDREPFAAGARPARADNAGPRSVTPAPGAPAAPAPDDEPIRAARIADAFEWRPVRDDGEMVGLAVYPRGDGSVFASTGLRAGDVVVSINGVEPSRTAAFLGILEELDSIDALVLIVDRNGARETFNVALR